MQAAAAVWLAGLPAVTVAGVSPLIVGFALGAMLGNSVGHRIPDRARPGINFAGSQILRLAIVLYGFRLTFQDLAAVGSSGLMVSIIMLTSTMVIGVYVGKRIFALDRDTSLLAASGSSICGVATVVATESVLRSDSYKTAVAVGTVVLFGTLSLILYPVLYKLGLLELDLAAFAIYVGATVHEVAQVVAIGNLVGVDVTDKAIVVKLTRVFLLVPTLLVLAWLLRSRTAGAGRQSLHIPWFAVGFVAVVGFHSLHLLPPHGVALIVQLDTFLLTVAMCALGLETTWAKVKAAGLGPFYLGLVMFLWLAAGGYFVTRVIVSLTG